MASWFGWLQRGPLGTEADRATFRTLHTASLAGPPLRAGLTAPAAEKAVRHLKALLGAPAIALTDADNLLAWDGRFSHHAAQTVALAQSVVADGATSVAGRHEIPCADPKCPLRHVVVSPLTVEERVVGTLQVFTPSARRAGPRHRTRWPAGCPGSSSSPSSTPPAPG